jgi:hypothetical protein
MTDTRVCRDCRQEKPHRFDQIVVQTHRRESRKVYRDGDDRRWYNAVCAECFTGRYRKGPPRGARGRYTGEGRLQ